MILVLLVAAVFRFAAIDAAPPGWRDDELIEFDMDRRIAQGWRPLFIAEAEGHEPVYHYLHAATIALFGENVVGYKWLPLTFGMLSVALTFALTRRLFDSRTALIAAALMAVSFWPVMYARLGLRHIGIVPLMLGAFLFTLPRHPATGEGRGEGFLRVLGGGVLLAAALMTYFAGRALPLILIGFLAYLLIFHRAVLRRVWLRTLAVLAIAAIIAAPMFVEIARTPGAEKRTEVVGGPLIAALRGDLQPVIDTTLGTLGMFTFAGDPESLYNVPGRPVFDWLTGLVFYLGLGWCLLRLRRIASGFVLVWWLVGIAPAFVSVPAASFSHTIAAQPAVYVMAAVGMVGVTEWVRRWYTGRQVEGRRVTGRQVTGRRVAGIPVYLLPVSLLPVSLFTLSLTAFLTIRDYFGGWANDPFVRFQYHAPTRDIARWLDDNPNVTDIAVGTHPNYLWLDPLALAIDLQREDVKARWFNPDMALVVPVSGFIIVSPMQLPGVDIQAYLKSMQASSILGESSKHSRLTLYEVNTEHYPVPQLIGIFNESIGLYGAGRMIPTPRPGDQLDWIALWQVIRPIPTPRLKTFVHLLDAQERVVAGDDRLDVNVSSLLPGDLMSQFSQLALPADLAPGTYPVEIGLYHSDTGERLRLPDQTDRILLDPIEVVAP
jgi:hypothetical protein